MMRTGTDLLRELCFLRHGAIAESARCIRDSRRRFSPAERRRQRPSIRASRVIALSALVASPMTLPIEQPELLDVGRIHEYDVPCPADVAQPVFVSIDRRIELVVRTQRHQAKQTGLVGESCRG